MFSVLITMMRLCFFCNILFVKDDNDFYLCSMHKD